MDHTSSQDTPLNIRKQPNSLRCKPPRGMHNQPHGRDNNSTRDYCNPLEGPCFKVVDFVHEKYAPSISDNMKQTIKICDPNASEILTTAKLISAVGQLWDCASRPLSVLQSKANSRCLDITDCKKENAFRYIGEGNVSVPTSADCEFFSVELKNPSHLSHMVRPKLENVKASQEISLSGTSGDNYTHSFLSKFMQRDGIKKFNETWKACGLASVGNSYKLEHVYKWMHEVALVGVKCPTNISMDESKKIGDSRIPGDTVSPSSSCYCNTKKQAGDCRHADFTKKEEAMRNTNASFTSLYLEYFLGVVQDTYGNVHTSQLCADNHVDLLVSNNCASGDSQHKTEDDGLLEEKNKEFILDNGPKKETTLSTQDKPHYALAKPEHAFAGALAGIFVSLCLHPVDTVKTVVQTCHANQNSFSYISRSIISNRGLMGLYRGITSNIASSAPISALYTLTYESVKGALLPLIPKESHSLAHCVAGGSASIATSFIFTPSERIKQQMQVGSHYGNCWNALVGVLRKGGLPSLYAGWGAVLCRNIPHSIIKFYTYESLKQSTLSSLQRNSQLSTFQTLVCGGLAGSTAALFTTPFDVVKTRVQTQIPGSVRRYDGVFHTLQQIGMHEGLKALYRGLIPRFIMYMSQGALFFASYESFKRLLSLEVPQLTQC